MVNLVISVLDIHDERHQSYRKNDEANKDGQRLQNVNEAVIMSLDNLHLRLQSLFITLPDAVFTYNH